MTLDELKSRHSALLAARYSGTRSVSFDGKTVNYGTDAELAAAEHIAIQHPRDLVTIKLAQYHHFNLGDATAMLRLGLRALPACDDQPYVHGMIAFGYEQCHLMDAAETSARRALDIEPSDPWAHHALAHVMLTQNRVDEGITFLESVAPMWAGLNSFMRSHNWWHMALFYSKPPPRAAVRRP